jgi:hypothetical protein
MLVTSRRVPSGGPKLCRHAFLQPSRGSEQGVLDVKRPSRRTKMVKTQLHRPSVRALGTAMSCTRPPQGRSRPEIGLAPDDDEFHAAIPTTTVDLANAIESLIASYIGDVRARAEQAVSREYWLHKLHKDESEIRHVAAQAVEGAAHDAALGREVPQDPANAICVECTIAGARDHARGVISGVERDR